MFVELELFLYFFERFFYFFWVDPLIIFMLYYSCVDEPVSYRHDLSKTLCYFRMLVHLNRLKFFQHSKPVCRFNTVKSGGINWNNATVYFIDWRQTTTLANRQKPPKTQFALRMKHKTALGPANWHPTGPTRLFAMGLRVRIRDLRFHYFAGFLPFAPFLPSNIEHWKKPDTKVGLYIGNT